MNLDFLQQYLPQSFEQQQAQAAEEERKRKEAEAEQARRSQQLAATSAPVAPQAMAYNAQMESGNNPNIGYHNPQKSTAYGTYGITAPAYQDIQRANPQFANRPITSLSPQEQTQAAETYRNVQAQQLRDLNVEPSDENLRMAHLLGSTGTRNLLTNNTISPEAAAANGGEQNLRQMAFQRRAGQVGQAPTTPLIAGGTTATDVLPTPTEQAISQQQQQGQLPPGWNTKLAQHLDNPQSRDELRRDPNTPPAIQKQIAAIEYEELKRQIETDKEKQKLQAQLQKGDWAGLLTEAKKQSDEGSVYKAALYSSLGLKDLAAAEEVKLGAGRTWQPITLADGSQGIAQVGIDGLPIKGFTQYGDMTPDQLAEAAGMNGGKADYVGGSVVNDRTGQIGRLVSRNNRTMVESGGRYYPATTAWRNNTVGTDLNLTTQKAAIQLQSRLAGMSAQSRLNAFAETNQALANNNLPLLTLQQMGIDTRGNLVVPQQGQAAQGGVVMGQPSGVQGGTTEQFPATGSVSPDQVTLKAKQTARTEIVKKAADVVADQANIIKLLGDAERNVKILDSGKTNFGTVISGMVPGEAAVGQFFKTKDAINTNDVLEYVNRIAATNAKMLGTNPTDRDLAFVTSTKPDSSWSDSDVKEWIKRSEKAQRRTLEIARKQIETGGTYEAPLPGSEEGVKGDGTKDNPYKL